MRAELDDDKDSQDCGYDIVVGCCYRKPPLTDT